ncbi:MAG: penicillin-binding protein 1C [Syntrophaceae bacterium]|nr:penicillin-binding protein 1C [Syntrophaceae bacterium]
MFLWAAAVLVLVAGAAAWVLGGMLRGGPPPPSFAQVREERRLSEAFLLDRSGRVIHELRVDPSGRRLPWVALGDVSPALVRAVVRGEDRRFRDHGGVDWLAAAGALARRIAGGPLRGASTITMQLAARLDREARPRAVRRTWAEKIRQVRAARRLEESWTKDQILEAYLNLITFRGELQGVAAASRGLFGKDPAGLTNEEAYLLAALIPAGRARPEQAAARAWRLARSLEGTTTLERLRTLAEEQLGQPYFVQPAVALAPHVARLLLTEGGRRITSTLDGDLQRQVLEILNRHLDMLRDRNVQDGAVLVADNRTGAILAYAGNQGAGSSAPFVDGIRAPRQAGSTLKPFLYGLALERRILTAASILEDAPLEIPTPAGLYMPENYSNHYAGPVSVRTALSSSLNVPAVRVLGLVGAEPFALRLREVGFAGVRKDGEYYGWSLALGSADVTLWELVTAYRVLANGGRTGGLTLLPTGKIPPGRSAMDRRAAFIVSSILADRGSRSTTFGLENVLATRFWTAVKTGTSKDMRDNWCIGYSERYTVGVWIGNFSGASMWNVTGISGAAPVWLEVMNVLHGRTASGPPVPPKGVTASPVRLAGAEPDRTEWFLAGTEPGPAAEPGAPRDIAAILYPPSGAVLALDPDIPEDNQRVSFLAKSPPDAIWILDGRPVGKAVSHVWPPVRGDHVLSLADADAKILDTVRFSVK